MAWVVEGAGEALSHRGSGGLEGVAKGGAGGVEGFFIGLQNGARDGEAPDLVVGSDVYTSIAYLLEQAEPVFAYSWVEAMPEIDFAGEPVLCQGSYVLSDENGVPEYGFASLPVVGERVAASRAERAVEGAASGNHDAKGHVSLEESEVLLGVLHHGEVDEVQLVDVFFLGDISDGVFHNLATPFPEAEIRNFSELTCAPFDSLKILEYGFFCLTTNYSIYCRVGFEDFLGENRGCATAEENASVGVDCLAQLGGLDCSVRSSEPVNVNGIDPCWMIL